MREETQCLTSRSIVKNSKTCEQKLNEELEALRKQLGETLEELTHLKDHFLGVFPPEKTKD